MALRQLIVCLNELFGVFVDLSLDKASAAPLNLIPES